MGPKAVQCKHLTEDVLFGAIRAYKRGEADTPDVALRDRFPAKVVLAKMRRFVDRGVLDYGVSLRTAWIVSEVSKC